ncbi:MAG: NAD+ synthase [Bacteroidales bacterium]
MRIALAQLNYLIGDFEGNYKKIISGIAKAVHHGAELIVFSELSVCGYPPLDLLEYRSFIGECKKYAEKIAQHSRDITVLIGIPVLNPSKTGKDLFNAAMILKDEKIEQVVYKTLLPTYDIFDEYRHFESNREFGTIKIGNIEIALTICEDLWDDQPPVNSLGRNRLYNISPLDEIYKKSNPDLIINMAASPFSYLNAEIKKEIFIKKARKFKTPVIFVNQVGANTELLFEGGSMVVDKNGEIRKRLQFFQEDFAVIDTDEINQKKDTIHQVSEIESIHEALLMGIRDYFRKQGFKKAILGLSGGIDSAVSVVLATRALGNENVRVLLLPSKYSSDHSVTDSERLCENIGIQYSIIPIQETVEKYENGLQPLFNNTTPGIAEENIQARTRMIYLMAVSNKFGEILLNTSNKSEAAVGYGTLYGDMAGGLSILGDVYKTKVYELAKYINREHEIIPVNIIEKPPSAELRPEQKDSDSLPDYEMLDEILFRFIENQQLVDDIIRSGIDSELVEKVLKMVNTTEYKRYQTPPILRVTSKAFGPGRRIPIVAKY